MTKRARTEGASAASAASLSPSLFLKVLDEAGSAVADYICAADLYALRLTSRVATQQLTDNYLVQRINRCITDQQIGGVLTFDASYQPGDGEATPRMAYLLQLLCVLEDGGQWAGWVGPMRIARHGRVVESLPITVRPADVRRVGSKAVFDGRADSLKQYSLFGHLLGQDEAMALRQIDGVEQLGDTVVTVYTQQTLSATHEFAVNNEMDYMSFRHLVVKRFPSHERSMCHRMINGASAQARWQRAVDLLTQAAIPWGRQTRTVDNGRRSGSIYLCGGGQHDTFAALMYIDNFYYVATIDLYTTETPQPDQEGPFRFPQTLQLARQLLGKDDEETLFGDLTIEFLRFGQFHSLLHLEAKLVEEAVIRYNARRNSSKH
ncbi:unnamed protein product [Vitrella brassicaformis CCMP3155]|uniref:Uncharacterized protein n=1 Tax=Vitrella brassicaformis (strain CCMP3155) TaxID=1169540 RepID=A0A0G4EUJ7_VITBC|nr:unnamed protein product [Vitrella brassicaformis CCMP3155]|eukprot:CEM01896.1 unnamed protein product [Vitrella brassicaformis CCMP3155]